MLFLMFKLIHCFFSLNVLQTLCSKQRQQWGSCTQWTKWHVFVLIVCVFVFYVVTLLCALWLVCTVMKKKNKTWIIQRNHEMFSEWFSYTALKLDFWLWLHKPTYLIETCFWPVLMIFCICDVFSLCIELKKRMLWKLKIHWKCKKKRAACPHVFFFYIFFWFLFFFFDAK